MMLRELDRRLPAGGARPGGPLWGGSGGFGLRLQARARRSLALASLSAM